MTTNVVKILIYRLESMTFNFNQPSNHIVFILKLFINTVMFFYMR